MSKQATCAIVVLGAMAVLRPARETFSQSTSRDFSELEKTVTDELRETGTPGCAVAIVSGDRVVFAKGFGTANVETGAPVTPDMLFRVASITKMYTTYALVALANEGKLRLNRPIGDYVQGLSPKLAQLTAHQLMSHTSGMKDASPGYGPHDESSLATAVRSWKDDQLFIEPGKMMSYSNPGMALVGFLVQEIGGKPYADMIDNRLLKPLGMNSSTFRPTEAMTHPLSQGHVASREGSAMIVRPFTDNAERWPSGYLFSSALELSRFAIAFMNEGQIDGRQVLDPAVLRMLETPYADVPSESVTTKYGYGLRIGDFRGVHIVEHGGAGDGFGALFQMAPAHRFAVIVLANKSSQVLRKAGEKAIDLFVPLEPKQKDPPPLSISSAELSDLIGVYVQVPESLTPRVELAAADQKLMATVVNSMQPQGVTFELKKTAEDRFSSGRQLLAIIRGADGMAEYVHLQSRAYRKQPPNK